MLPPILTGSDPADRAAAVVRAWCGWHVAPVVEEALILDGNGTSRMALPSLAVVDVTSVKVDGVEIPVRWSADGWITRPSGVFPDRDRSVTVELRHGFAVVPDVEQVVAALLKRDALGLNGIVTEERVGPFSTRYASGAAGVHTAGLLEAEKAVLSRYRLGGGVRV